jgi:hypothetical protein
MMNAQIIQASHGTFVEAVVVSRGSVMIPPIEPDRANASTGHTNITSMASTASPW